MSDAQALEVALIENLQREDLNPMEEAEAFKKLSEEFSLTQEQVSARVGKSRPHIANTLRLLNLASDVQQMVREARLSMGHARALLALESATVQKAAAERIVSKQMSVREAEEYVNALLGRVQRRPGQKSKQRKDPQVEEIETRMRGVLGTRVKITGNTSRGRMEIHYFSQEELERVVDAILMRLDEVNGFGE
jgi:ParB family chromosome partitioning protein